MNRIFLKENATLAEVIETAKANNAKFIIITRDHYRGNGCGEIFSVDNLTGIDIDFRWYEFPEDRGILSISVTADDCVAIRDWQENMYRKLNQLFVKYNSLLSGYIVKGSKVINPNRPLINAIEAEMRSIREEMREKADIDLTRYLFFNL